MRRHLVIGAVLSLAVGGLGVPASVAAPNTESGNKLQCYVFSSGTCTPVSGGYTLTVTEAGGGVALYINQSNIEGKLVSEINKIRFTYDSTLSPRFTFQTVEDGFVSVEAATCNDGAGLVDVLNDATCSVHFNDGSGTYPNWAAFVEANPTTRLVSGDVNTPFILLDTVGSATITGVQLGKGTAKRR